MDITYHIYKITCHVNGRFYIGKTKQDPPSKRWLAHLIVARGGREKFPDKYSYIHNAINEYGEDSFSFEIIDQCIGNERACELERHYIETFKTNVPKYGKQYGYNLTAGGEGAEAPRSEETKQNISKSLKGKFVGEKNHNYGRQLTDEHKKAISEANLGKKMSPECIEKRKQAFTERGDPRIGRPISETTRQNRALSVKKGEENPLWDKPLSIETRQKLSDVAKQNEKFQTHTEIAKQKISDKRQGQDMSYRIPTGVKDQVIALFDAGKHTKRQLAKQFDLTLGAVKTILKRRSYILTDLSQDVIENVVTLHNQGISYDDIAKQTKMNIKAIVPTIYKFLNETKFKKQKSKLKSIPEDTIAKIITDYVDNNLDRKEVCIKYGYSEAMLKKIVRVRGVKKK